MGQRSDSVCNDYCGYYTPVNAHVLDWRLGASYYCLLLVVLLYVFVYNIWYKGEFVITEAPIGSLRISVRSPTYDPASNASGCNELKRGCESNLRPLNELSYCSQSWNGGAPSPSTDVLECTYWDAMQAVLGDGSDVMIPTRVVEYKQESLCQPLGNPSVTSCRQLWAEAPASNVQEFYIADVESFTLLLDHKALAPNLGVEITPDEWQGALRTRSSKLCATYPRRSKYEPVPGQALTPSSQPPCWILPNETFPPSGLQIFTMGTLLEAAGVDLDGPSLEPGSHHTVRYEGIEIVLMIEYSNFAPWSFVPRERFRFEVNAMHRSSAKRMTEMPGPDGSRTVRNNHGIEISVIQTGKIGKFSAFSLLVTLTTALTMIAVASFSVDTIATYFLPEKDHFVRGKYPEHVLGDPEEIDLSGYESHLSES
eukprot:TRINITY_DN92008_c0_g1_i1.p1 TRINITY_DN92008_c0_g1~~TRINITY_DN92008_c0_g1_i1.p1  ORF type:complete len:425 (-),score=39.97 TRINITY_DN92008_c0_g1_i1:36-1310(-)